MYYNSVCDFFILYGNVSSGVCKLDTLWNKREGVVMNGGAYHNIKCKTKMLIMKQGTQKFTGRFRKY